MERNARYLAPCEPARPQKITPLLCTSLWSIFNLVMQRRPFPRSFNIHFRRYPMAVSVNAGAFFERLGTRVAELRRGRNITQVKMAATLFVSQQISNSYEVCCRRIPVSGLPIGSLSGRSPGRVAPPRSRNAAQHPFTTANRTRPTITAYATALRYANARYRYRPSQPLKEESL